MTHPCVKCGKELEVYESEVDWNYGSSGIVYSLVCENKDCPAYSFLQAGLEPVENGLTMKEKGVANNLTTYPHARE